MNKVDDFDKTRDIKSLLTIVLKHYKERKLNIGLCGIVDTIQIASYITNAEAIYILNYMRKHRPIKVYYTYDNKETNDASQFWYPVDTSQGRIKWLNKHIKLNSK